MARAARAEFSAHEFAYGAIAALLLGGDGINLFEPLRADGEIRKIFGLEKAPSDATSYRILCELAGLEERAFADAYAPAGPAQDRLDMFGGIKAPLAHRRLVPETPEAARPRQFRRTRARKAARDSSRPWVQSIFITTFS